MDQIAMHLMTIVCLVMQVNGGPTLIPILSGQQKNMACKYEEAKYKYPISLLKLLIHSPQLPQTPFWMMILYQLQKILTGLHNSASWNTKSFCKLGQIHLFLKAS